MRIRYLFNIPGDGDLDIEKIYTVYGISIWNNTLRYLLSDQDRPNWYLGERFELIDKLLPLKFYFSFNKNENIAIFSYKEMVFDHQHYIDLIEREPEALKIFKRRKEEIDEYEE